MSPGPGALKCIWRVNADRIAPDDGSNNGLNSTRCGGIEKQSQYLKEMELVVQDKWFCS